MQSKIIGCIFLFQKFNIYLPKKKNVMAKLFSYYKDNVDRAWYESSNVVYSECVDKEGELKTLRVVFKNGAQYEYKDVDVNQYLLFREASSQGKALNQFIKQYEFTKLENADLEALEKEYEQRSGNVWTYTNEESFEVFNEKEEIVHTDDKLNDDALFAVLKFATSIGLKLKKKE